MKNNATYFKELERRLRQAEQENKMLRLKAEAYETVIQIAEEQFNIPILKKSGARRLSRGFVSLTLAQQAVEQVVATYNNVRPHASLNYRTPRQAHRMCGYQPLRWYPYKKVRSRSTAAEMSNSLPTRPIYANLSNPVRSIRVKLFFRLCVYRIILTKSFGDWRENKKQILMSCGR